MALTKLRGQNFRAFYGHTDIMHTSATPFVEAVNCNVTIQGSLQDASTKDTVAAWNTEQMTSRGWSVQVEALAADLTVLRTFISLFNSDTPCTVGWDQTAGAQNRVAQNAAFARSGSAILNDFTIQADNRSNITTNAQFQGTGALA